MSIVSAAVCRPKPGIDHRFHAGSKVIVPTPQKRSFGRVVTTGLDPSFVLVQKRTCSHWFRASALCLVD